MEDPKSQLNQFCQNYCKRPLTKEDIVYTTSKFGQNYQTIVKLNCLGGQEYAGNLRTVVKEAEKEAAVQALTAYAAEWAAMKAEVKDPLKKRKIVPTISPEEQAEKKARIEAGENPAFTPKVKLNSLCMKIAKRFLQKGETIYKCMNVPGGYQATVQLACLPGEWKDRVWAGHVCNNRQKAEQSAAEISLQQIMEDPQMMEEANKTQAMKGSGAGGGGHKSGGGKSSGKGWGENPWYSGGKGDKGGKGWGGKGWGMDWGMDWGAPDYDAGMDYWGPPPWMWSQGWSEGGWKSKKEDIPRHRISDTPLHGEVVEWKGSYAWVKPSSPIEHKSAKSRGGKVYVHKNDLTGGLDSLSVGQTIQFFLYEDGSGLGGEEVQVMTAIA